MRDWPAGWLDEARRRLELPEGGTGWTPRPVLPLPAEAPYDVDVVVVGGGPAGMAAAVRARWIKSFHAVPCSVAVFESGRLGGLSTWRTSALTGPAWRYLGDELVQQVWPDLLQHQIPILPERVERVERWGAGFQVVGTGTRLRCRSVVLAAGMRALHNEPWFLHRGLFLTYMGYGYFSKILARAAEVAAGRGLVVVGNARSRHIASLVAAEGQGCGPVTWVVDGPCPPDGVLPGRVVQGTLRGVLGAGAATAGFAADGTARVGPDWEPAAKEGVRGVRVATPGGERELSCGAVLLDYNAFELTPSLPWDGLDLARTPLGAVDIDPRLHTSVPGVFAAGDLAGERYKSVAMAIGDGVAAGFAAVRHVHQGKFGTQPNLYAYAATDRPLSADEADLPWLDGALVPLLLHPAPRALRDRAGAVALPAFDGVRSMDALVAQTGVSPADLRALLRTMLERKLGTVHRALAGPASPLPSGSDRESP